MSKIKSKIEILDGNQAAAWGARLAKVKSVPCFPITPQTEIIETIAQWKADGKFKGEFYQMEGEHSVLSAAFGSQASGARTFTASSSQGLLYMHEMLPIVAGTRLPIVMVNVSRALSAPISLWCDHNDFLSMRDSGWIMISCETNQEILDSVIMAYKIGENPKISLPVLINMDGFIHSFTRTQVNVPTQKLIDKFLTKYKPNTILDPKNPMSLGTPAMDEYMDFRAQNHKALLDSKKIIKQVQNQWYKLTKRKYDLIETYKTKDAKAVFVIMGANSTICRKVVKNLRKKGKKIGMLKLRLIRPFPQKEIQSVLKGKKAIIMDQNIAPGIGGILSSEIKHENSSSYIFGLGGKPISEQEFEKIAIKELKSKQTSKKWVL